MAQVDELHRLNAICPYFTMFPLEFPLNILHNQKESLDDKTCVFDPFCGRGTTNFAARLSGYYTVGLDSNPVAVHVSNAKIANVEPSKIVSLAKRILRENKEVQIPEGDFWELAYAPQTLKDICKIRASLLRNCKSDARVGLLAIMLGALHGPMAKQSSSYFSNQSPRTYAPKPNYAVKYWNKNCMRPVEVNLLDIIEKRAVRYYSAQRPKGKGLISKANSCSADSYKKIANYLSVMETEVDMIITSPPYYGLKTYVADQWLRNWFVGGKSDVDYSTNSQIKHSSVDTFVNELKMVWRNSAAISHQGTTLAIRFGAINDRVVSPQEVITRSLHGTPWAITSIKPAGSPPKGRRQMESFISNQKVLAPIEEIDVFAVLNN